MYFQNTFLNYSFFTAPFCKLNLTALSFRNLDASMFFEVVAFFSYVTIKLSYPLMPILCGEHSARVYSLLCDCNTIHDSANSLFSHRANKLTHSTKFYSRFFIDIVFSAFCNIFYHSFITSLSIVKTISSR